MYKILFSVREQDLQNILLFLAFYHRRLFLFSCKLAFREVDDLNLQKSKFLKKFALLQKKMMLTFFMKCVQKKERVSLGSSPLQSPSHCITTNMSNLKPQRYCLNFGGDIHTSESVHSYFVTKSKNFGLFFKPNFYQIEFIKYERTLGG